MEENIAYIILSGIIAFFIWAITLPADNAVIDALYSVASTPEQKQLVQNVQSASDVSGNIHDANELEHGLAKGTVKIGVYFGVPAMILVGMIVAIKNEL